MKRLIVAAVLTIAACSPTPASDITAGPQSATAMPAPAVTATSTTVVPTTTIAPTTTTEATETIGADASFDESYLSLGAGRAFPVLDDPRMVAAVDAVWLEPDDVILGLVDDGVAQAFPTNQIAYHHIINTTIAGGPYVGTY